MPLNERQMGRIANALKQRQANEMCPRCRNNQFSVAQGIVPLSLSDAPGTFQIGGATIPCAVVVCMRCGWTALHALTVLGLTDLGDGRNG